MGRLGQLGLEAGFSSHGFVWTEKSLKAFNGIFQHRLPRGRWLVPSEAHRQDEACGGGSAGRDGGGAENKRGEAAVTSEQKR